MHIDRSLKTASALFSDLKSKQKGKIL